MVSFVRAGQINLVAFEKNTTKDIVNWLRDFLRLPQRNSKGEVDQLIGIIEQLRAMEGHGFEHLSTAFVSFLESTWNGNLAASNIQFTKVLNICSRVALTSAVTGWFFMLLGPLAEGEHEGFIARAGSPENIASLLRAGIQQLSVTDSTILWEEMIKVPALSSIALEGFGPTFESQFSHLKIWWGVCPESERAGKLVSLVEMGRTEYGIEGLARFVANSATARRWSVGLKLAFNSACVENQMHPIFT